MASISGTQSPVNTGSYGAGGSGSPEQDLKGDINSLQNRIDQMKSQGSQGGNGSGGGASLEELEEELKRMQEKLAKLQQSLMGNSGSEDGGKGNGQIPQPDYQGGGSINP